MAIYSSGSINFSQLGSETDFKQLIEDLSKIETKYANKLLQWRADWKERMEAFGTVRSELQNLRNTIATLNTPSKFMTKSVNSSSSGVAVATANADAKGGSYSLSVKQLATRATWSMNTGLMDKAAIVNDSGAAATFKYTYKGQERELVVPAYTTLEGLQRLINSDTGNPGVTASLVQNATGIYFQLSGNDTGSEAGLAINETTGLIDVFKIETGSRWLAETADAQSGVLQRGFASTGDIVNTTPATQQLWLVDVVDPLNPGSNPAYQIDIPAGATLDDVVNLVNAKSMATGYKASLVYGAGGTINLKIEQDPPKDSGGTPVSMNIVSTLPMLNNDTGYVTNWEIQENQNAMFRVNGVPSPPHWLQKNSNNVTDVIEGLDINLRSVGDTVLTVELDKESLKANVEKFVEAVNKFLSAVQALTTVDTNKTVAKPDFAESQFDMQMGGVLTGNYGVQTVQSKIKQALASSPAGFLSAGAIKGAAGDMFSSLSQVGIYTCSNEGDPNFGLLVINEESGKYGSLTLNEAIEKDALGVAELFAANSQGKSHSPYFSHYSHVEGQTEAGTYEVIYTGYEYDPVTGERRATGTINGSPMKYYEDTKTYGIDPENGGMDNPAFGLLIQITDFAPEQRSGHVSIRNGMVNTLLGMFDGPEGMLSKENGALTILENNYKDIIKNIDDKLLKEDERLARWQRTMQLKFSRLETTLGTYNKMQEAVKSMIQQLGQNSSSNN